MTERLTSLRLMLERARRYLSNRSDIGSRALLSRVESYIGAIAVCEAGDIVDEQLVARAADRGRRLLDHVRDYAKVSGESFTTVDSPCPQKHDTSPHLSTEDIRIAIAAMPPGATEPPEKIAEIFAEAHLRDGTRLLPPEAPTGDIPDFEDDDD